MRGEGLVALGQPKGLGKQLSLQVFNHQGASAGNLPLAGFGEQVR